MLGLFSADGTPAEALVARFVGGDVPLDDPAGASMIHREPLEGPITPVTPGCHDVGVILNPVSHQGQIEGAVVQGFGKVGYWAAHYLAQDGCKLIAISDVSGGYYQWLVYCSPGIQVLWRRQNRERPGNGLCP